MIVIWKFTLSWSKVCITISEKRALEVMTTQQFSDPRKNKSVRGSEIHVPRTHVTPPANQTGELWPISDRHRWRDVIGWLSILSTCRVAASTYHCHYLCHFVLFDIMFCPLSDMPCSEHKAVKVMALWREGWAQSIIISALEGH